MGKLLELKDIHKTYYKKKKAVKLAVRGVSYDTQKPYKAISDHRAVTAKIIG